MLRIDRKPAIVSDTYRFSSKDKSDRLAASTRALVRPVGLDMVEVGGSNPPGPAKFLSLCFYSTLYFQDSAFRRVSACGHYRGKVMTKDCLSLPKLIRGVIARY